MLGACYGPVAFLWITFGGIFMGAMHDFLSGVILVRNDGLSITEIVARYLGKGAGAFMRVFSIILLLLVGVVFVVSPADILATKFATISKSWWLAIIICYYFIATLLPIDKLIGKVYPLFGVPGTDCDYHCRICSVQELVDALPGEVTAENADAVAAQLSAIDTAKADLSTEELEQIDFTRYTALSEALGSFQAAVPIPEDETPVVSVNITWGEMNFTYTDETGWTDNGTGWIEVENTGDTAATVTANYQNNDGFNFTGTFTETVSDNITKFVLSLSGRPTRALNGETIGKVTLTIE